MFSRFINPTMTKLLVFWAVNYEHQCVLGFIFIFLRVFRHAPPSVLGLADMPRSVRQLDSLHRWLTYQPIIWQEAGFAR